MFKKFPHTYVIIFTMIIISAALTWVIPSGEFERVDKLLPDGSSKSVIVENTFRYSDGNPQTWQIFSGLFKGFVKQADIIVFILLIGGAFWIINTSKSIDVGILSFLRFTRKLEKSNILKSIGVDNIVITMIMLMFSIFGAVFGMSEETIAFVIILVPLSVSMGYDSILGVCMVYVAAHVGFASAVLNPFTIGIAQGLSDLPIFSGMEYRILCWFVLNFIAISFVLLYARRIKRNPKKSITYHIDQYWRDKKNSETETIKYYTPLSSWIVYLFLLFILTAYSYLYPYSTLTIGNKSFTIMALPVITGLFAVTGYFSNRKSVHFFILNLLAFTIIFLMLGVLGYQWYVMEISTLFLALGLSAGIAISLSANEITKQFLEGVKDFLSAALVVGLAGGIIIILSDGKIIDTIMYRMSSAMSGMGKIASVEIMYGIQTLMNLVITSASAKAALTMPIMAPFSDMIDVSRQATVLAFQFGDGFTNMITPASGVLIAVLGIARIPYNLWFKWMFPLLIILLLTGALLLIPTVIFNLNGF
jgi:uncharacterized ion transporter superfamily protein YfcC